MIQKLKNGVNEESKKKAEEQIKQITKSIDYVVTEYTIEILKHKFDNGDIFIPNYQREFTWDIKRQSQFIESILMGLPIPFLFFWEDPDSGRLEIVDGSQRLRTLKKFMENELILQDLEKLNLLINFKYDDIVESRQRKFKNKSIRGIILTENTDLEARFDLFRRINTGSKIANPAEVRRAALSGPFMDMVISLSENKISRSLIPTTPKSEKERLRDELITRFFAYSDGLNDYKDKPSEFIFHYVEKMNKIFEEDKKLQKEYEQRVIKVFDFVRKYFPYGFKKTESSNTIPRVRFESIALGVFHALQKNPSLTPSKKTIESIFISKDFIKEIRSDGANSINRIKGRINVVKNILLQG